MAGSILATRTVFPHTRLRPTQKISIEPTVERLRRAVSVIIGTMNIDSAVTAPCSTATGIAEKMQPLPREPVIIIIIIKSSMDLVRRME